MSFDDGELIVADPQWPAWRARLVPDDAAAQPWGDFLAPALLIGGRGKAQFAAGVFQPAHAERILAARDRLDDDALLERYLRMVHGTSEIVYVTARECTVMLFDTQQFRRHSGCPAPCKLTGDYAEWRAWLDGEVFGIVVEHNTATADLPLWVERDAVWGFYGYDYSCQRAAELVAENAASATFSLARPAVGAP